MPVKIHLIPGQKLQTKDSEKYANTNFTFQRDGSEEIEKGTIATYKATPTSPSPEREAIEAALLAGTPIELEDNGKTDYGQTKFKLVKKGGFSGGGGGGRPAGGYKGKPLDDDAMFQMYFRTKLRIHQGNVKIYGDTLTPQQLAEMDRAEAAQFVIMVKENVFVPKESK